jgi:hypothetical protein
MAIGFADEALVFLANPANQGPFPGTIGLAAFATTSFTAKYGKDGFQVNAVTLGVPSEFQLEKFLWGETRTTGSREKRGEQPERYSYELRISQKKLGWIDVSFAVPVQLTIQAVPGSVQLGPGGDVVPAGVSEPQPLKHSLRFKLPVQTDPLSLAYGGKAFVFATSDPAPVADMRRICEIRRRLEEDPGFLASLDGSAGQAPYLFVQLYQKDAFQGTALSEGSVVQAFAAIDVLAAFITIPAM